MKVVFFSTNSNEFKASDFIIQTFPTCKEQFEEIFSEYKNSCEFFVVTELPATFLVDFVEEELTYKTSSVQYFLNPLQPSDKKIDSSLKESSLTEKSLFSKTESFAEKIFSLNPDVAIAASFWVRPYDWLSIQDAMIAENLRKKGVSVLCNSVKTCVTCFDKFKTHLTLKNKYNVANSIFVQHALFWADRSKQEIKNNVYKEYIFCELENLKLPVIAKDTLGLSSYGMEVLPTLKSVRGYLLSHKNSSDRIIEEYIKGEHFGVEVYGTHSNYWISPLFAFSVSKYGITSPKHSVKLGPITNSKYNLQELEATLFRLATDLELCGVMQVDLVFSENKWFIIEVNPRLSGMSSLVSVATNTPILKRLLSLGVFQKNLPTHAQKEESSLQTPKDSQQSTWCHQDSWCQQCCSIKVPLATQDELSRLAKVKSIKHIYQFENKSAKQLREQGYCELIFNSADKPLLATLEEFRIQFPRLLEEETLHSITTLQKTVDN